MSNEEKTCWRCKRVLVGKSALGLCPDCVNKYGTPAAVVGTGVVLIGGKFLLKTITKIVKH